MSSPLAAASAASRFERPGGKRILRVYALDVDEGKHAVDQVLDITAKRYRLQEALSTGDGQVRLDFVVELRKKYPMSKAIAMVYRQGAPLIVQAGVVPAMGDPRFPDDAPRGPGAGSPIVLTRSRNAACLTPGTIRGARHQPLPIASTRPVRLPSGTATNGDA